MIKEMREIIGQTLYCIVYPICLWGSFLLILLFMIAMFTAPLTIALWALQEDPSRFNGWRLLGGFGGWVLIGLSIVACRRPWEDNNPKFQAEEQAYDEEVRHLFPQWLPAYEHNQYPLHFFPFFWMSYCPKCSKRIHIEFWNSFRYVICSCGYRWAAQDNFIA